MCDTCANQLAAGDPCDSSPSAAAPAAGGRGIDGSRRVHSLGVRGLLAGGALEVELAVAARAALRRGMTTKIVERAARRWTTVRWRVAEVEARGGSAMPRRRDEGGAGAGPARKGGASGG